MRHVSDSSQTDRLQSHRQTPVRLAVTKGCLLDSLFTISWVLKLLAGDLVQHVPKALLDDVEGDLVSLCSAGGCALHRLSRQVVEGRDVAQHGYRLHTHTDCEWQVIHFDNKRLDCGGGCLQRGDVSSAACSLKLTQLCSSTTPANTGVTLLTHLVHVCVGGRSCLKDMKKAFRSNKWCFKVDADWGCMSVIAFNVLALLLHTSAMMHKCKAGGDEPD